MNIGCHSTSSLPIFKECAMLSNTQRLIAKIQALPPERLAEVDDFVDFLQHKDQEQILTQAAMQMSAKSLAAVWDNPDDEAYNDL
jgi:Protein of unknown function (DUF2281)